MPREGQVNKTGSAVERASFSMAGALDAQARRTLAKLSAERKPDQPPPAKLSDEFVAAIGAYKEFVDAHPESALVGDATYGRRRSLVTDHASTFSVARPLLHAYKLAFTHPRTGQPMEFPTRPDSGPI